jgi:hypothetical protein
VVGHGTETVKADVIITYLKIATQTLHKLAKRSIVLRNQGASKAQETYQGHVFIASVIRGGVYIHPNLLCCYRSNIALSDFTATIFVTKVKGLMLIAKKIYISGNINQIAFMTFHILL